MRVLFDQGTPVPLRKLLGPHLVDTAFERGWSTLKNSDLLSPVAPAIKQVIDTALPGGYYEVEVP